MKSIRRVTWPLLLAVLLPSSVAFAVKVPTSFPDLTFNVNVLLQARAQGDWGGEKVPATGDPRAEGASPNGTFNTDFYLRRASVTASGTAYNYLSFYLKLTSANFGRRGNFSTSFFVQDFYISYEPFRDFNIELGFLYMPLSHAAVTSAAAAMALEGPGAILFYNNARALRETGAQIRALLLNRRILVRGGVYEGLHSAPNFSVNPNGRPLVGGMLRFNFIGDEPFYFYPGIYLDGKSRVSIGVGGQYQTKGSNIPVTPTNPVTGGPAVNAAGFRLPPVGTGVNDYVALAADLFADLALPGNMEAVLQVGGYRFDWGYGSDKTGYGMAAEIGFRVDKLEPQANGYWFNSQSHQNSFRRGAVGLNYFLNAHNSKLGLEFVTAINGGNLNVTPVLHQIVFQAQVFF